LHCLLGDNTNKDVSHRFSSSLLLLHEDVNPNLSDLHKLLSPYRCLGYLSPITSLYNPHAGASIVEQVTCTDLDKGACYLLFEWQGGLKDAEVSYQDANAQAGDCHSCRIYIFLIDQSLHCHCVD
jgi:hypothetical protein